jgi:hypothetical protein
MLSFRIAWVRGKDWRQKQTPNQNFRAGIENRIELPSTPTPSVAVRRSVFS